MSIFTHKRPGALALVFVVVLLDVVSFGIVMPVLPGLVTELTGAPLDAAARHGGWLAFAYAGMQFLCGPLVGSLGDRFGRRPVVLCAVAMPALDYFLCGAAPSLVWLFAGRLLSGAGGDVYSMACAYAADVSGSEKRAQSFGLLGMAAGIGLVAGPALGGVLGGLGARVPYYTAAGLAGANALFVCLFVRESLPRGLRGTFSWRHANPVGALAHVCGRDPAILRLAATMFLFQLVMQMLSVWPFFAIERFAWPSPMIGAVLAAAGLVSAVSQGWLIRLVIPRIGAWRAAACGLCATAAGMLVYAFAPWAWVVFAGILVSAPGEMTGPSLNALMSRRTSATSQGGLQGAVASLTGLAAITGPLLATHIFALFSGEASLWGLRFPGMAFVAAAVIALAALAVFLRAPGRGKRE
jgi:DHA1 family tetracycline resistance protein-like MFS transporter